MNVLELNRDQLTQLKQAMLFDRIDGPSWGELAEADALITDGEAHEYFAGVHFVPDDFT